MEVFILDKYANIMICAGGEIGIHVSLRWICPYGCGGSSPPPRTNVL